MSILIPSDTELICSGELKLLLSVGPNNEVVVKLVKDEDVKYTFTIDDTITITSISTAPITNITTPEPTYLNIRGRRVHNVDQVNVKLIVELLILHGINQSNTNEYYIVHKEDTFPFRLIGNYALWMYETCEDLDILNGVAYPIESPNVIRKRYIWEPFNTKSVHKNIKIDWLPYLDNMLIKTGAVMAGSYPLREVMTRTKKDRWEPDDVDIFGLTLEFLRDIIDIFTLGDVKFRLYLRRLGHIDSYKLKIMRGECYMDDYMEYTLNYLHIADNSNDRPIDEDMCADLHRMKVIKFILTSFDIAVCASYYDGTHIYYNEGVDSMTSEVRGSCTRRMNKYKSRGFKLTGDLKDYTCEMYE